MIIWLASYPKSGNTWVRSFLANILYSNKVVSNKSIVASLGGRGDKYKEKKVDDIIYGGSRGSKLASNAINRNGIIEIKGYSKRKLVYEDFIKGNLSNYSAYVNIGGGVSSMGVGGNKLLDDKTGIIYPDEVIKKGLDNCVVKEFADIGVKFINIHNILSKTNLSVLKN